MQNSWPYDHNLIMRDNYPESNNDFKGYVENVLNEYNIPSVQACIIKKNSEGKWDIAWKKAYGDSGTGQANNDTIYPIGSLTKIITSTAVLQLYDRGVIDIDENINTYLPELGIKNPHPDYAENEITIRHLLTHRSGIVCQLSYLAIKSINTSPYQYNWKPSHNPLEFYVFRNLAEIRNFLRKRNSKFWRHTRIMGRPEPDPVTGKVAYLNVWNKPDPRYVDDNVYYAPGEHFRYANTNYHILGYLIEKVACDP